MLIASGQNVIEQLVHGKKYIAIFLWNFFLNIFKDFWFAYLLFQYYVKQDYQRDSIF